MGVLFRHSDNLQGVTQFETADRRDDDKFFKRLAELERYTV
ncbi:MAG: hypothetical protein NPIRA04_36040 [Nitrospirales bacterium]|nr:MAG: hypothetical protein NPIRA04_36040 [Nitrospirales bacterium]